MKKEYLAAGQAVGTHGVRGEIRVQPWCDSPEFLARIRPLFLREGAQKLEIQSARAHGRIVLLKIEGIDSIEQAERLRGKTLYLKRDTVRLPEGSHFIEDLLGCRVTDADTGKELGILTDVSATGANDVWHVSHEGREYLVPAIRDVVVSVHVDEGEILIRPLKGIFDD